MNSSIVIVNNKQTILPYVPFIISYMYVPHITSSYYYGKQTKPLQKWLSGCQQSPFVLPECSVMHHTMCWLQRQLQLTFLKKQSVLFKVNLWHWQDIHHAQGECTPHWVVVELLVIYRYPSHRKRRSHILPLTELDESFCSPFLLDCC